MTNEEVGAAWRKETVSALPWLRSEDQAGSGGGNLGGYVVVAQGFSRRSYLKPGAELLPADRTKCHAAREKIAADLAHDLGLPIPPAVLTRRVNPQNDPGRNAVVTLFLHPFQLDWTDVAFDGRRPPRTTDADVETVLAQASALLAFTTWVDDFDHGDSHPGNIVWGFDPAASASELVFLDYASSMGADGSWHSEGWKSIELAPFPHRILRALDSHLVRNAIDSILSLPTDAIGAIIHRVPEDFLPEREKSVINQGLIGRRTQLLRVLAAQWKDRERE